MERVDKVMKYFAYEHLPEELQKISKSCSDLAEEIYNIMESDIFGVNEDEWYEGLRKLLEAKDCFVRARV
jgi:hypothetical protein